jgi:tetratricopeptide (TPR) repeat protein
MTDRPTPPSPDLPAHRSSSQEFLYNRTESRTPEDKVCDVPSLKRTEASTELLLAFPNLLTRESFVQEALAGIAHEACFAALAVQIDTIRETGDDDLADERCAAVTGSTLKALETVCQPLRGVWGELEPGLFGCFLPDVDEELCRQSAEKLQQQLARDTTETVSIGMATFPCSDFQREDVMDNARKALIHASFFGPGSRVLFDSVSLNISGDHYYQHNDIDAAMTEFQRALKLDPDNVNVHNSLGVCHAVREAYDEAQKEFEAALAADGDEVMAIYNLGLVHSLKNEHQQALEAFLKAWQLDSGIFEIAFQAGRACFELQQFEKALEFFDKALALNPDYGPALRFRGKCLEETGLIREAIDNYIRAVKRSPNDADALSSLGHLYAEQGENLEIAIIFCRQSVDIAPHNGLYHYRLAHLYLQEGQPEQAVESFERAAELGHDAAEDLEKARQMMTARKAEAS